ncbi:MAG: biotin--[Oscillospiraceae bacterium]|nr:biotin--[acetyl-CoA-carboxylase] ligase [Oscillospiraceae bacterium]
MSLKDDVLLTLEKRRGLFVSGQEMADALGVTRAAVNKAVSALKSGGYEIEASTKLGYRIAGDVLSEPGVRAYLPEKYRDIEIIVLRETDSTNNEAKRRLTAGLNGTALITAEQQTGGRGRRGRAFSSPPGTGVYITLAVPADAAISDAVSSTARAATAAAAALEELTGREIKIKWVNDLYLDGKKISGILTEAVSDFETGVTQTLIIGIGINLKSEGLPEELRDIAGAIDDEKITRCELIGRVAGAILDIVADLKDKSYIEDYKARSMVLGREVTFSGGGFEAVTGRAIDIDGDGGLVVRLPDGTEKTLRSGEITLRVTGG